jgi:hypothetical protein
LDWLFLGHLLFVARKLKHKKSEVVEVVDSNAKPKPFVVIGGTLILGQYAIKTEMV